MDTVLALMELTIWGNAHGLFNLRVVLELSVVCTVDFQLDYSDGAVLTFSVTSVPQTINHPGKEEGLKNILAEFLLVSHQESKLPFTAE